MRTLLSRAVVVALALGAPIGLAVANDAPAKKAGKYAHPNLAAAHKLTAQAVTRLDAAQQARELDAGGHAAKARELLRQAQAELELATRPR